MYYKSMLQNTYNVVGLLLYTSDNKLLLSNGMNCWPKNYEFGANIAFWLIFLFGNFCYKIGTTFSSCTVKPKFSFDYRCDLQNSKYAIHLCSAYGVFRPASGWSEQLIRNVGANKRQIDMQIKHSLMIPRQRRAIFFGRYPPSSIPPPDPGIVIMPGWK